jgi:glycine/serine hydroxymethyltransferase
MAFFDHTGNRYYCLDAEAVTPVLLLHRLSDLGWAWAPHVAGIVPGGVNASNVFNAQKLNRRTHDVLRGNRHG